MIVVNEGILEWFGRKHNQAKKPLEAWLKIARQANWHHLMDVRRNYPATDGNVKSEGYTVFNVKGNSYRLLTKIDYKRQIVEVTNVFTHSEYDQWDRL